MQSRAQATLLDAVGQALLSPEPLKKPSRFRTDTRRYAIYFGSKASLEELESITGGGSTWEFSAPLHSLTGNSSQSSYDSEPEADGRMTPAQQIVLRYRAGHSTSHESGYSSPSLYSEPDPWATASMGEPSNDLKAVFRESRYQALQNNLQEAANVALLYGVAPDSKITCPRTACGDVLPNLKALMYHLHIHDIHDRTITCTRCQDRLEDERAMESHRCDKPAPLSMRKASLKEAFHRIMSMLTFPL